MLGAEVGEQRSEAASRPRWSAGGLCHAKSLKTTIGGYATNAPNSLDNGHKALMPVISLVSEVTVAAKYPTRLLSYAYSWIARAVYYRSPRTRCCYASQSPCGSEGVALGF